MKNKEVDVVKLLIEQRDKELSINQVAKLLKKDYKNTHNMVTRLVKMSLVKLQPFGKSQRVILLNKVHPLLFEAEYSRRNDLLKNRNIVVMDDAFTRLRSILYILLVFGSYAKKTYTKNSDIDLLFIVPDRAEDSMEKEIHNITSTLPLNLHVHIFKETDFKAMKNSKEITVGSEAMRHNIVLHGVESYYELLQ